jgi:integrase
VATLAREARTEIHSDRQLALFDVLERGRSDAIVPTDTSPRANCGQRCLTLGEAARIMREAVKDKSYRSTPVGLEVAHFIRWFRNEYGATSETLRDYEAILAKLAIDHADLELADFEPPDGTTRLRDFIDERWGDAAPRTRKKVRAVLMSFFKWAQAEFKLQGNPVVPIRSPRLRDVERELFSADDVVRIVAAQPELRDRVALKLLFLMGLRKGELAAIRYRDFDLGRRRLRVHGKGGKIRHTPIPTEELRQDIAEVSLRRDSVEHLLYPQKRGPKGTVIWENRRKPLSGPALHRWWYRCLARAGVVDEGTTHGKKMHSARYTSGTEFYLATGGDATTARRCRRQHDREYLRPGLARRPRGEAAEGLGRVGLMARRLGELLDDLETVEDDLTIYAATSNGWDGDSPAVVAMESEDRLVPPEAVGMAYLLEVGLAKEAIRVWSEWRNAAIPTSTDRLAAVVYYATHDAYVPVQSDE